MPVIDKELAALEQAQVQSSRMSFAEGAGDVTRPAREEVSPVSTGLQPGSDPELIALESAQMSATRSTMMAMDKAAAGQAEQL